MGLLAEHLIVLAHDFVRLIWYDEIVNYRPENRSKLWSGHALLYDFLIAARDERAKPINRI